jgi:hypothetical protein
MFESICIKRQDDFTGNPIDLGLLAEAILFYQHVHVVADGSILKFLLRTCGPDVLLELLHSGTVTMTYLENGTGIRTSDQGTPKEKHDFVTIDFPSNALQNVAPACLQELTGKAGKGRRLAYQFLSLIKPTRFLQGASAEAIADLQQGDYVRTAISALLTHFVPEYLQPSPLVFEVVQEDGPFFRLISNVDFGVVNGFYNTRVPISQNSLSATLLLGVLVASRQDVVSASEVSADLAVPPSHSIVARCKFEEVLRKRSKSQDVIDHFQDFVLKDGRSIAEAVNGGYRNMADVLQLAAKARKFKEWVKERPEDTTLREEYCKELMHLSWADKLPSKSIRWALFTTAATTIGLLASPVVGAVAGVALSASDTFLVDQVIKGWRRNHFVQGPLQRFIS